MDITDAQYFLEKEKEAENYAVPFVAGGNFSDCLRMYHFEAELEVDVNAGTKKIQAHRIYGLWETYLIAIGEVTGETITIKTKSGKSKEKPIAKQPDIFTGSAKDHMEKMYDWITTQYTDGYKAITTKKEQEWLKTVIRFAVLRRIMEYKYHKWLTTGKGFADTGVAMRVAEIYRFKYEIPEIARLINTKFLTHKDRAAEDWEKKMAQDIIIGIFDMLREDRLRLLPPINPNEMPLIEGEDAI